MRRALAAIALALALVACGSDNKLDGGRVIDKSYDDPDSWWTQVCVVYGKYGCQSWVPQEQHDRAHWHVKVEGRSGGKRRTETHEVDQATWEAVDIGDDIDLR